MFMEKNCDHCGKEFFPTECHAYKKVFDKQTKWFCKYSCMLRYQEEYQKSKGDKKNGRRKGT